MQDYSPEYIAERDRHQEVFLNTPGMLWDDYMKLRSKRKHFS